MKMRKIVVIYDRDEVINYMGNISFTDIIGLVPSNSANLVRGMRLDIPDFNGGNVIDSRRHVFRFWRKEYLIEKKEEIGLFYRWIDGKYITIK